ncbi:MAG: hypothetical protein COB65_11525, partial [Thalassobium sp.]
MSIWTRIAEAVSSLTSGEGLSAVFEKLRTPPERSAAFAIAVIALRPRAGVPVRHAALVAGLG